jgi:hypothetical protein
MATQIQKAIDTLNGAYNDDRNAIHALMCNRVPCNHALADHPTVQVDELGVTGGYAVGALGLINGVVEAMTGQRIALLWSDATDAEGRRQFWDFANIRRW